MSFAATLPSGINLGAIVKAIAPAPIRFDPFGIMSGYKAYDIYSSLDAKSDAELAAMGLDRAALPAVAMAGAEEALRT